MGAALGLIGAGVSGASALFGLINGTPASNVPQAPPAYQLTAAPQTDQALQGATTTLANSTVPGAINASNLIANNPGAGQLTTGAGTAANIGTAAGTNQFLQGGNLVNTGNSLVPYATAALNQGFNTENAVYNQQFQQQTDQTRALLEARGIDNTPYGAGVEAQTDINFNNAWQLQQLQNQATGAQTANTLLGLQGSDVTQGTNLQATGSNTYATAAGLPYNAYNTIGTNTLAGYGASSSLQQQPIQDYLAYLSAANAASGTNASITNANTALANAQFNQSNTLGNNLGAALTALGKGWGGTTASYLPSGSTVPGAVGQTSVNGMPLA
jgi:hypothetical protein